MDAQEALTRSLTPTTDASGADIITIRESVAAAADRDEFSVRFRALNPQWCRRYLQEEGFHVVEVSDPYNQIVEAFW